MNDISLFIVYVHIVFIVFDYDFLFSLFFVATEVVTVFVFQEPSLLSSLQDNGLTDVMLHALLIKDVSFQHCPCVLFLFFVVSFTSFFLVWSKRVTMCI